LSEFLGAARLRLQFRESAKRALKGPAKSVMRSSPSPPSRLRPRSSTATKSPWDAVLQICRHDPSNWESTLTSLFDAMDSDGDGSLDSDELALGLAKLGVVMTENQVKLRVFPLGFMMWL
jgi:hypothetical protein